MLLSSNNEWVGRPDGELRKPVREKRHVEGTGSRAELEARVEVRLCV